MGSAQRRPGSWDGHVIVVGGGIAGVEVTLALALGHPGARVTLLSRMPKLRIIPNLVYVPFGVAPEYVDIDLDEALAPYDHCSIRFGTAAEVDVPGHALTLTDGTRLTWDALVVAPGTVPDRTSGYRLRNLTDAEQLHDALDEFVRTPWMSDFVIRILPDSPWSAPAYELAFLADGWLRAIDRREDVDLAIITDEREPFELLGPAPVSLVAEELSMRSIHMLRNVQPQRIEDFGGDVVIDVGGVSAARVRGLPGPGATGFYATDAWCRVAEDTFVVGDAASFPIKAGFATAWQARRVLRALGGDFARLGVSTDGVPHDRLEYQMDLGGSTLAVTLDGDSHMVGTGLRPSTAQLRNAIPEKLHGTLVQQQLVRGQGRPSMPEQYRRIVGVRQHLTDMLRSRPGS